MNRLFVFILIVCIIPRFGFSQDQWNLEDCLAHAKREHASFLNAQLNHQLRENEKKQRAHHWLPNVNLNGSHGYSFGSVVNPASDTRESVNIQNDNGGLNLSMELFNFDNFKRLNAAQNRWQKSQMEAEKIWYDLQVKIIQKFYQYQLDKASVSLNQEQIKLLEEQLQWIEKEVEIGSRAKADLYQQQLALKEAELQLIQTENKMGLSKLDLEESLFLPQDSVDFILESTLVENLEWPLDMDAIVEERPEYQTLNYEEKALESELKSLRYRFLPSLNLNYGINSFYSRVLGEENPTSFSDQWKENQSQWITLNVSIPIFDGFSNKYQKNIQAIQIEQIKNEKKSIQNELNALFSRIKTQWEQENEVLQQLENMEDLQAITLEKTIEQFREGLTESGQWVNAQTKYRQFQNQKLQQTYQILLHQRLIGLLLN